MSKTFEMQLMELMSLRTGLIQHMSALISTSCMILLFFGNSTNANCQKRDNLKAPGPPQTIGFEVAKEHAVLFGDALYGEGVKALWLPQKGAFRAGRSAFIGEPQNLGYSWDSLNIGIYSTSFGSGNLAKGSYSMTWGEFNIAEGAYATMWGAANSISSNASLSTVWGYRNELQKEAYLGTVWGDQNVVNARGATAWGEENNIDSMAAHFSTAWGSDNIINGPLATVWGEGNTVVGELATVWGEDNQAKSDRTTVWGKSNIVNAIGGTSWGNNNRIEDEGAIDATVWGLENIVEGNRATAWGSYNSVSGSRATAWGLSNIATGISSTAFGGSNIANGGSSMAVGQGNTSNGYATSTIGVYAKSIGNEAVMTGIPTPITADYPLFVIGNGSLNIVDFNNPFRSNALTVSHKGYVGINFDGMPNADLVIKQSDGGYGPSTGGIALLDDDSINEYWQIQTVNNALTFKRNGSRISRLTEAGVWEAADFFEGNLGFLRPETQKSTKRDITKLRIGYTQTGKRAWDAESLVGVDKNLVSYDEDNQPFGVNYKLLYMMTIEKLQDQQKVIEKQGQINLELSQQLQYLEERFVHLEKIIKEK